MICSANQLIGFYMIATSAFNELISLFIDYLAYFYPIYKLPSQLNRVFLGALLLLKKYQSKPNFLACEVLKYPRFPTILLLGIKRNVFLYGKDTEVW